MNIFIKDNHKNKQEQHTLTPSGGDFKENIADLTFECQTKLRINLYLNYDSSKERSNCGHALGVALCSG